MNIPQIIKENFARLENIQMPYDPLKGIGSMMERKKLIIDELGEFHLPLSFFESDFGYILENYNSLNKLVEKGITPNIDIATKLWLDERCDHDFEFYAAYALKIEDKDTGEVNPFILRRAQRRLLYRLERMRLKGVPIRMVLLKARQWGGSTLVQMYMLWIQQRLKENWHISVCAQVDDAAKNIRNMYEKAVKHYPSELGQITLSPYAKSAKNLYCKERGGIIGVGSVQNPDQFRSYSNKMIHMSEVGVWQNTLKRTGAQIASSLKNAIANVPNSVIVEESTAKGVGNYFHDEWVAAQKKRSRYDAVFVPWFEIELYESKEGEFQYAPFIQSMSDYEWMLWSLGATLENIHWYREYKNGENKSDLEMFEEYPSTPEEAFVSSGSRVYPYQYVLNARETICDPIRICTVHSKASTGKESLKNISLVDDKNGNLSIWIPPEKTIIKDGREFKVTNRFAMFGDFGGTSEKSDFSALAVMDRIRMLEGAPPEIAAIWHGKKDAMLFAWIAAQVATLYDNALLALESNTPDQEKNKDGNHFLTAITQLAGIYHNLYIRNNHESTRQNFLPKYGFHTNTATKGMIIDRHKEALRSFEYVERNEETCSEMDYYENTPEGKMEAQKGKHDDLVIVTAGATWLSLEFMPPPKLVEILHKTVIKTGKKNIMTHSTF